MCASRQSLPTFICPQAVQFHHRVLALTTLGSVAALWTAQRRAALPPATRTWLNALLAATAAQVC